MKTPHRSACSLFCLICTVSVAQARVRISSHLRRTGIPPGGSGRRCQRASPGPGTQGRRGRTGACGGTPQMPPQKQRGFAAKMHLLTYCQWWANINYLFVTSPHYKYQRFTNKDIDLCLPLLVRKLKSDSYDIPLVFSQSDSVAIVSEVPTPAYRVL